MASDMRTTGGLDAYCERYRQIEDAFEHSAAAFGLPFEATESQPRSLRPLPGQVAGLNCENCGCSIWRGWISPACVACRTARRSETFYVSLACTRSCYFCFNPNQEGYEQGRRSCRDIAAELTAMHAAGRRLDFLAVTGGEPMLQKGRVLEFLHTAARLYPDAHVRLYTSGDLTCEDDLRDLAQAGLDEIRFSVKPGCDGPERADLLDLMRAAKRHVPAVMVEMPVEPGTLVWMEGLLVDLDAAGIDGINLLELCFPLNNAHEFARRGFELRRRPFEVVYDWWYAGGLPVAGSEAVCLELLDFAQRAGLSLGIHYCSRDNKDSGQVYLQNVGHAADWPVCHWSQRDWYLKTYKVFDDDVDPIRLALRDADPARWRADRADGYIEFHPACLPAARAARPEATVLACRYVVERRADGRVLRELGVEAMPIGDAPGVEAL